MRVLSLFSGAGGLDYGFQKAGFEILWAIDNYRDAVDTYRKNIGKHIVCEDIRSIKSAEMPDAEVVIGGFPCQGFSIANMQRSHRDGRNKLYLEFVRVIEEKKPSFFVAENVKGILSLASGQVFEEILDDFNASGYDIIYFVLNAANYGVPQLRERVFLVGVRKGTEVDARVFPPSPTHAHPDKAQGIGLRPWISIGDALSEIPEPESDHDLPNHDSYTRYKLRFNGYLGHRRIDPESPLPTITARGDSRGGVVILHHPRNHRRLSPREAAIAQGFPVDFEFMGSQTSAYRQIANAVPPPLAEGVAKSLSECVKNDEYHPVKHGTRLDAAPSLQYSLLDCTGSQRC